MTLRRRATIVLTTLATVGAALLTGAGTATAGPGAGNVLPLGASGLPETRTTMTLAPGVTYTKIVRGYPSASEYWSVQPGVFQTEAQAQSLAAQLDSAGHPAKVIEIDRRPADDPERGPLVWLVRVGRFQSQADATAERQAIAADGLPAGSVVYSGEDGLPSTGPWVVHVLRVDRSFRGSITNARADDRSVGRETPSSIARRYGAIAATNASFFVITPGTGYLGDAEGISAVDGQLDSEAINGKAAMLLPGGTPRIGRADTYLSARSSDGSVAIVDGRDRPNGQIFGCGGVSGDQPTELPLATYSCTDSSEIIQYLPAFGPATPSGDGLEAVLDAHGRVQTVRPQGGPIPANGSTLVGTGSGAEWLSAHAAVGSQITVSLRSLLDGRAAPLRRGMGAVAGGPMLVQHGRVVATGQQDGFNWPDYGNLWWSFGDRRNARTLAGTTDSGDFLLVAVDGYTPNYSIGLSIDESAQLMRALGAVDAINLDGGGSTSMVIDGSVVNRPSDAAGERPVGDAMLIMPPQRS